MTKQTFLEELKRHTGGLTDEEQARLIDYYSEMIDDRVEEGIPEEEAVAALGDPAALAKELGGMKREAPRGGSETVPALNGLRVRVANADVKLIREPLDNGAAAQLRFSDPARFEWRMDGDTLEVLEREAAGGKAGHRFDPDDIGHSLERGLRWLKQMITEPDLRLTVVLSEGLAGALDFESRGGDLRAEGVSFAKAQLVTASGDVALTDIACAGGIGIDIRTHSGDVQLSGLRAPNLIISAASGDISGQGLALSGCLRLETTSGDVELRSLECDGANVVTTSGDIEIDRGRCGAASFETASGDVRLDELEADPSLAVETISGDIDLTRCIARETRLNTVSSDVAVRLEPLPCGYDIAATTVSGDITLPRDNPTGADPQPKLAIRTVSGDIGVKIL